MSNSNSVPRRNNYSLLTSAELAIYNAMVEVEKLGADVRLTNAIMALQDAKSKVSDYTDEIILTLNK